MEIQEKITTNEVTNLISPIDNVTKRNEEPKYEDFISRISFINRTGIFVTPDYFLTIYDDFKASGESVSEFVDSYEEKHSTCVEKLNLKGIFKYEITDDVISGLLDYDSEYEPNIWEIMNCLAIEYNYQRASKFENVEICKEIIENLQDINVQLMKLLPNNELTN